MPAGRKLTAFRAFRPFQRMLNIQRIEALRNPDGSINARNACLATAFSITQCALCIAIATELWTLCAVRFNLHEMASNIGILINATQAAITYGSLKMRAQRINAVIDGLRQTISRRESLFLRPFLGDSIN